MKEAPKSDKVSTGFTLRPPEAAFAGQVPWTEGLRYGRDNWRAGAWDVAWILERDEHAERHRMYWRLGMEFETDHLSKVTWWNDVLVTYRDSPEFAGSPGNYFALYAHLRGYDTWAGKREQPGTVQKGSKRAGRS